MIDWTHYIAPGEFTYGGDGYLLVESKYDHGYLEVEIDTGLPENVLRVMEEFTTWTRRTPALEIKSEFLHKVRDALVEARIKSNFKPYWWKHGLPQHD